MALSLLQDAQTRGLAAAFAGMRREEVEQNMSMSPSVSTSSSNNILYPGLQHAAAASALGMISPHLLAANRQAAAAFMASQLPMSRTIAANVASSLFPPHPVLFGSWSSSHLTPHLALGGGGGPHSPPASPQSPVTPISVNHGHYQKHSLVSPKVTNSSNISTSSSEAPPKKTRKISVKKELTSPPIEISMSVSDLYQTSGPISPPSSGSSPNSSHDIQNNNSHNNKDASRDKSFTCTVCSRSFGYKHVLQNHERTHTGEKPFECPECHKRFTRDHHLKTHMRLHTGEKPYHCSHCDRQFVQVANLRRHLRVHTGERPYTCEICDGKFSDSNQLKSHMLVHNGESPFECDSCHVKFRRRHHILNHKCGVPSPPTPAISPAISENPFCDQKSTVSQFDGSEESIDLNSRTSVVETPLDLSEEGAISSNSSGRSSRKPHDIRRVFRLPPQIALVISTLPEQTEPEDLSLRSTRDSILQSPLSLHHDDIDLDELDDAAALYLRHQRLKADEQSE